METYIVKHNQITNVDCRYFTQKLAVLELHNNMISVIPPELFNFPQLQRLSLAQNQVERIPAEIIQYTSLEYLNLS
jgi:Leucine-rich repeat (LRR) protein